MITVMLVNMNAEVEWYCMSGPKESDDEIVRGYFLHTREEANGGERIVEGSETFSTAH